MSFEEKLILGVKLIQRNNKATKEMNAINP
jgi:hypothetical protein